MCVVVGAFAQLAAQHHHTLPNMVMVMVSCAASPLLHTWACFTGPCLLHISSDVLPLCLSLVSAPPPPPHTQVPASCLWRLLRWSRSRWARW
jgi:hypothetical protein